MSLCLILFVLGCVCDDASVRVRVSGEWKETYETKI